MVSTSPSGLTKENITVFGVNQTSEGFNTNVMVRYPPTKEAIALINDFTMRKAQVELEHQGLFLFMEDGSNLENFKETIYQFIHAKDLTPYLWNESMKGLAVRVRVSLSLLMDVAQHLGPTVNKDV